MVGNINFLTSHGTPGLPLVAPPVKIILGGWSPVGIPSLVSYAQIACIYLYAYFDIKAYQRQHHVAHEK